MKKSHLIEKLARTAGISLRDAQRAVNTAVESMADPLADHGRVAWRGLGCFKVNVHGGYSGRNPRIENVVEVPAKKCRISSWEKS